MLSAPRDVGALNRVAQALVGTRPPGMKRQRGERIECPHCTDSIPSTSRSHRRALVHAYTQSRAGEGGGDARFQQVSCIDNQCHYAAWAGACCDGNINMSKKPSSGKEVPNVRTVIVSKPFHVLFLHRRPVL